MGRDGWTVPDLPAVVPDTSHQECKELLQAAHRVIRDLDGDARVVRLRIEKFVRRLDKENTDPGRLTPTRKP